MEFIGGILKKTRYTYAAIIQSGIDEEGEVKVMCLKTNNCNKKLFRINENDVSYAHFDQIKAKFW